MALRSADIIRSACAGTRVNQASHPAAPTSSAPSKRGDPASDGVTRAMRRPWPAYVGRSTPNVRGSAGASALSAMPASTCSSSQQKICRSTRVRGRGAGAARWCGPTAARRRLQRRDSSRQSICTLWPWQAQRRPRVRRRHLRRGANGAADLALAAAAARDALQNKARARTRARAGAAGAQDDGGSPVARAAAGKPAEVAEHAGSWPTAPARWCARAAAAKC